MITKDLFFSLDNPIIFSLLISVAIIWMIYFFYMRIYNPLQSKHQLEKENLELKNSRLMAMFAELDPEPLFRFNDKGEMIFTNESGSDLLNELNLENASISDIFPFPSDFSYNKFITNGDIILTSVQLGDSFYDITAKGIPEIGVGQIYCNDITVRKKTEDALESSQLKLRDLSVHIHKVQEEEKKRISRELHDNFGQMLTSIKMNLELLNDKSKRPDELISDINKQLEDARKEIREISYRLRPRVLDDFGLAPALNTLCEDISAKSGIKGIFQSHNYSEKLNPEIETNIYRIVQEALNNIVKHSKASEFFVQLIKHEDKLTISIDDDGKGFNPSDNNKRSKSGMGMISMSERAISLNGKFNISSAPLKGTEILVEIPLEENYE
jgi:signal transduction histidine kinase